MRNRTGGRRDRSGDDAWWCPLSVERVGVRDQLAVLGAPADDDGAGPDAQVEVQHAGLLDAGDGVIVVRPAAVTLAEELDVSGAHMSAHVDLDVRWHLDLELADTELCRDRRVT